MRDLSTLVASKVMADENDPIEIYELYLDALNPNTITHRFVNHITDLVIGGDTYVALGVNRSGLSQSADLTIDAVNVELDDIDDTFVQSMINIDFNGRRVVVKKMFLSALNTPTDAVIMFDGYLSDPAFSEATFRANAVGYLDILELQTPRRLFSSNCQYTFGDTWCTISRTAPENYFEGTAEAGGSFTTLIDSQLGLGYDTPTNYWLPGEVLVLTGPSAGHVRPVSGSGPGYLIIGAPFPAPITAGTQYQVFRKCDKTNTDCRSRFNNFVNFGGFHTIPKKPVV